MSRFAEPIEDFAVSLGKLLVETTGNDLSTSADAAFVRAGLAPFCPDISSYDLELLMGRIRLQLGLQT